MFRIGSLGLGQISRVWLGTPDALIFSMTCVRTNRSSFAMLVAVLLATGTPLFAAEGSHQPCTAKPDCHKVERITECCCCGDNDATTQPGLTQSRIDAPCDQAAVCILPIAIEAPCLRVSPACVDTPTLRDHSPGLPILFADLRL
jgi:hypothetical protein